MLFVTLTLVAAVGLASADCNLPLPRFGFFAPLIFSQDGNLLPTNGFDSNGLDITIPANTEVILSCAPNYFKKGSYNNTKWMTATCKGQNFEVNGVEEKWISGLGCEVRPVEETLKSVPGCPNDATSVEFGYENPIKQTTNVIGEACYTKTKGRTLFVHTKIVRNGNTKTALLKTESVNYLAQNHPDSQYKLDFLKAATLDVLNEKLRRLLSERNIPFLEHRHFIELSMFQNGQLLSALKLGWNFVVANGYDHLPNYDLLLEDIMSLNENFDLYLGTHDVLSLQSETTKGSVDIYLQPEEQKYPVPKYLWIVVKSNSGKGVGFLVSNDIDADVEELTSNSICQSKCAQLSWARKLLRNDAYKNPKNGFVTCCELDSFKNNVLEMPSIKGKPALLTQNQVQNNQAQSNHARTNQARVRLNRVNDYDMKKFLILA